MTNSAVLLPADPPPGSPDRGARLAEAVLLLALAALFCVLRGAWIGHVLTWDEAMNLAGVRAWVGGGEDPYSNWFWRHPPGYLLLLSLLSPLQAGFAERAEVLTMAMALGGALVLYVLVRHLAGRIAAAWSFFLLAIMPGAVFFDTWIKQDSLLAIPGLLALAGCFRRRFVVAGMCLGVAFLIKETAIFYALAAALAWLLQEKTQRRWQDAAALVLAPILIAGWWYIGFSTTVRQFALLFSGQPFQGEEAWHQNPWDYYLYRIPLYLGWAGTLMAAGGALALVRHRPGLRAVAVARAWPALVLVPALVLLHLAQGKTTWMVIALFPAFAGLQAVAAAAVCRLGRTFLRRAVMASVLAGLLLGLTWPMMGSQGYDDFFKKMDFPFWWGSVASREAATLLASQMGPGDRALVTPMYYWTDPRLRACAIFTYYFGGDHPVLVAPNTLPANEYLRLLREYNLQWAMISVAPDAGRQRLLDELQRAGVTGRVFRSGLLLDARALRLPGGTGAIH